MKRGFLTAILVVLAAASCVRAGEEPDGNMRVWMDVDYLLWWLQPAPGGPPLLTTGPLATSAAGPLAAPGALGDGILGASGTSILAGNNNLDQGPYSGYRISGGWMNCNGTFGVDGSFFFLTQRGLNESFGSDSTGNPLLARPVIDARTGNETVLFVSAPSAPPSLPPVLQHFFPGLFHTPGAFAGNFSENSLTRFFGADGNLLFPLVRCPNCYPDEIGCFVTALGGFRYLNLLDDMGMTQNTTVLPDGIAFFNGQPLSSGSSLSITDDIRTLNQFYGGQIGLKAGLMWWRLALWGTGKVALGDMYEHANLSGSTTGFNSFTNTLQTVPGGLYVLSSNAGGHTRNITAVVPEGTLNLSVEITSQIKLTVGYTIIYVSDVARPGDLIDRTVNPTLLPSSQTFNPSIPGPARPGFSWTGTDFWAQGINAGLSLRF